MNEAIALAVQMWDCTTDTRVHKVSLQSPGVRKLVVPTLEGRGLDLYFERHEVDLIDTLQGYVLGYLSHIDALFIVCDKQGEPIREYWEL